MAKPKRQHWVPRFYLRHFATPTSRDTDEPKVWIFAKDSGDPSVTSTKNVAQKRYLYSPKDQSGVRDWKLEHQFAENEDLMCSLWPMLAEQFVDLHGEHSIRKGLALFVSLLHLRHPRRLAEIERIHSQLVETFDRGPKDALGDPDVDEIAFNGVVQQFDSSDWHRYKNADSEEKRRMFIEAIRDNAIRCAELLMQKRWSVIFSEKPVFITTDTPVAVYNQVREPFGLNTPGTVISLPLTPSRVLIMDDRHEQPKGQYYPLSESGPGVPNFVAWHACDRLMFSSRPTDEVCAEMLACSELGG